MSLMARDRPSEVYQAYRGNYKVNAFTGRTLAANIAYVALIFLQAQAPCSLGVI